MLNQDYELSREDIQLLEQIACSAYHTSTRGKPLMTKQQKLGSKDCFSAQNCACSYMILYDRSRSLPAWRESQGNEK